MRLAILVSLVTTLGLNACASRAPAPVEPAKGAVAAGGLAWQLTPATDGEEARLAYGLPDTDMTVVMLSCRPKSGQVAVTTVAERAPREPFVTLVSQAARSRRPARTEPAELTAGVLVEASAPVTDPAIDGFMQTGSLDLAIDGRRIALPAADPAKARAFVETCTP